MLLEDLGDDLYARIIADDPSKECELYEAAIDTLASFPSLMSCQGETWRVREYDALAFRA